VYGQPAIVAGMQAGVRAHASAGTGTLRAPAWQLDLQVGDDSPVSTAVDRLCQRLGVAGQGLDLWLEAEVPARAGLGSSAAMAVAIARAVAARTGAGEDDVLAAAAAAEAVFHSTPSGIDTAAASRGGVGRFDRVAGWQSIPVKQPIEICVGLSGQTRQTGDLVRSVAVLSKRAPVALRLIDALGDRLRVLPLFGRLGERPLTLGLPLLQGPFARHKGELAGEQEIAGVHGRDVLRTGPPARNPPKGAQGHGEELR